MKFLIPIISFLGSIIGIALKKLAKEEIKFGKFGPKYFVWMKRILLLIIILTTLSFTENYFLLIPTIIAGFIIAIFLSEYLFLGTALTFAFSKSNEILILIASLIFLYGLPYGSMLKRIRKEHIYIAVLFFIPFLLLLTNINQDFLIGFIAGGCFNYLIRK